VRVFSNVCTHLACRVVWNDGQQAFTCPCHAAAFDRDGNVLDGPPPRPLDLYEAQIDETGNLSILFKKG
jgi:cytochrome b6-f complex iron-sulfur subunit